MVVGLCEDCPSIPLQSVVMVMSGSPCVMNCLEIVLDYWTMLL